MSFELSPTAAWYLVQTKARKESEAFNKLRAGGLKGLFPKIHDGKVCSGRQHTTEAPLFPGYLFVRMIPSRAYYKIKWTKGVVRFVGWGDVPASVADEVVEIIRKRMDEQGRVRVELGLKPGEEVKIRSGPLKDLIGIFDGTLSPGGRVRLLLQLVGSQVSVNVPESLVERNR